LYVETSKRAKQGRGKAKRKKYSGTQENPGCVRGLKRQNLQGRWKERKKRELLERKSVQGSTRPLGTSNDIFKELWRGAEKGEFRERVPLNIRADCAGKALFTSGTRGQVTSGKSSKGNEGRGSKNLREHNTG